VSAAGDDRNLVFQAHDWSPGLRSGRPYPVRKRVRAATLQG
jgi:hypothetical protein